VSTKSALQRYLDTLRSMEPDAVLTRRVNELEEQGLKKASHKTKTSRNKHTGHLRLTSMRR